jgi:hypothetical protein
MKKIDRDYFKWLTSQIEIRNNRSYNELFRRLQDTEFVWIVPNDDNRVYDGLTLRTDFLGEDDGIPVEQILRFPVRYGEGASVLEVIIGLSRRLSFNAGGEAPFWAWKLIENLHLGSKFDPLNKRKLEEIDDILERLIWRTYERNGEGGFFPLNWSGDDQRKIEIWYQMNAYMSEIHQP